MRSPKTRSKCGFLSSPPACPVGAPLCRDSEYQPEEVSPMTGAATYEGRRGPGAKITPQMPFPPNPFRSVSHYN